MHTSHFTCSVLFTPTHYSHAPIPTHYSHAPTLTHSLLLRFYPHSLLHAPTPTHYSHSPIPTHHCHAPIPTHYSQYRKLLHSPNIKIGSATIEETNNIKFLGIIFDKHLTFKHHVDVRARKIFKSVGILFKLSKYLPLDIMKTLYYSLINPFLLYLIEVWHGTYANITNKIFILQKKAFRAIHNLPFNSHNRIV